jgi:predicted nucleic-acid-binding protein
MLESGCRVDKARVLALLKHLLSNDASRLEEPERCREAVALFAAGCADFSDCVLLSGCRTLGVKLHSFDTRLGRLSGAQQVLASA